LAVFAPVVAILAVRSATAWGAEPADASANTTDSGNQTVYNMSADFAKNWDAKQNPNGVWKYGWSAGIHGDFHLFTDTQTPQNGNHKEHDWVDPEELESGTPVARLNNGGAYDNGNLKYTAGALMMQGGGPSWKDYAHIIWTAPAEGNYLIKAVITDQQHNMDADAQILVNGQSRFGAVYRQSKGTHKYEDQFLFDAGDTVDFAVGLDSKYEGHPGLVGLYVTIEKQQ
jgi:hypothetical protein